MYPLLADAEAEQRSPACWRNSSRTWRNQRVNPSVPVTAVLFGSRPAEPLLREIVAALRGCSRIVYRGPPGSAETARGLGCDVAAPATDMSAAVSAMRTSPATGDVLLVALDCILPTSALQRLLSPAGNTDADVLSPLGPEDEYSPLPEGIAPRLDDAEVDALCHLLSDPACLPRPRWAAHIALWRASAWEKLANAATAPIDECGLNIAALASLYVGRQGIDCRGPTVPEDRRDAAPASPLSSLRERIGLRPQRLPPVLVGSGEKPVVLHVLHGWGGGVERFVRDLAEGDSAQTHLALCASGQFARRSYGEALQLFLVAEGRLHALRRWPLPTAIADTAAHDAAARAIFDFILRRYAVGRIMVSSLIGHSLDVLDSELPTIFVCHDYYPLWPVLHSDFGDASQRFDRAALPTALKSADASSQPFHAHSPDYWWQLREAFVGKLIARRITLCAPSAGLRSNWLRMAPALAALRFELIPHGFRPFDQVQPPHQPSESIAPPSSRRLRLLVLGRINGGKAMHLLEKTLDGITAHADLFLIGCGAQAHALFGTSHVHIVLDYDRETLPQLIAQLKPDAALMPVSVAESFSYTLSELWALGIPPIASRIGSLAERIVEGDTGLLFDPNADALIQRLAGLAADATPLEHIRTRLRGLTQRPIADARQAYMALFPAAVAERADVEADYSPQAAEAAAVAESRLMLAAELTLLKQRFADQERELHARADWANQALRETQRVQQQLTLRNVEFEERTRWAETLEAEGRRLGSELQLAYGNYAQLEQEKRDADAGWSHEVDRVEGLRQELMQSTSWRITRPLRAITVRLRGLRARLGYWIDRILGLPPRLTRSLRTRGVSGTLQRIRQDGAAASSITPVELSAELTAPGSSFAPFALPRAAAPKASIVIPVYNKFPYTLACLQSIAHHGAAMGFEVIVVDDCSSDETRAGLATISGIQAVHNAQNLGFIGACNAGAAAASGEYLVFLNNDTQVTQGWLDALIDTFAQHRDVGLVGAKLVYPDGRLQEAGGIVFSDASGWNYGRFGDPRDPAYNYVREVDYCSGAAIAIARSLFEARGGFDTRYAPAYYEDTDLAFQVREAGLRVIYQPASVVVHFEGITSGTDTASGTKRYQVINQQKFAERWKDVLEKQPRAGTPIPVAREHRVAGRLLIVDATVPEPDKDSGSVRMVNLLRALVELDWKVSFSTENRAYVAGYTEQLQQLGIEMLYHPWMSEPANFLRDTGTLWDVVMLSRHYVATPILPLVRHYAPRARIVFDTVDLHYLREERAAELEGNAELRRTAATTKLAELRLIKASDITLVVSPVEQELLLRELPGARIEVLSNVHEVVGCRRGFAERRDIFFVGGFQHQPNVDAVQWFVSDIWPAIAAALPEVRFHIVGSRMPDSVRALASDRVIAKGFVESLDEYLDGCRLSIAPLRYGAGVKGKVNQSMAHGQPVVATALAAEGMYLINDVDVLIADAPDQFAAAVVRLYQDEHLWQRLSNAGLGNVERHFSFDAAKLALSQLLRH
jgi:O-antigen biosynthesis protein